ncbi:MAG: hypothetical protein AUK33_04240 [Flavobacteriaceae bacterium CG2_30_34_30]|nr:hypothetical protein [Flavobacteriales bacterium]OIP51469.1 MAG: hypothetical protein AUK33_04240 [Flavobacteriaceae bacterium CG2_30_34_30]PJC07424.1 MAG: hypothetical protein CO068_06285 [Flavobacteriaceae bacterium CG_4_9_14_0_8_um_filter_34_30]NCP91201.1 hypothetical protein [Flavobacteriales bacterium]NCQ15579.1 hypothetical protein [Flavobacteriales bacterium]
MENGVRPRARKLDLILNSLLTVDSLLLKQRHLKQKVTIQSLLTTIGETIEEWEAEDLKSELLQEGYIREADIGIKITHEGRKFLIWEGGYYHLDYIKHQDKIIRQRTIEKFQRDKFTIWISVIALVISFLTFFLKIG